MSCMGISDTCRSAQVTVQQVGDVFDAGSAVDQFGEAQPPAWTFASKRCGRMSTGLGCDSAKHDAWRRARSQSAQFWCGFGVGATDAFPVCQIESLHVATGADPALIVFSK